jgi:hypothetical protein
MSKDRISPGYPSKYYAQLLFFSKSDLEWAASGLESATGFYHKPCFEARESVEKALKAFLEALAKQHPHCIPCECLLICVPKLTRNSCEFVPSAFGYSRISTRPGIPNSLTTTLRLRWPKKRLPLRKRYTSW